jgi:hypothetical protein
VSSQPRRHGDGAHVIVATPHGRGSALYENVFCARSKADILIKDMTRFTRPDKTACSCWQANRIRLSAGSAARIHNVTDQASPNHRQSPYAPHPFGIPQVNNAGWQADL